MTTKSYFAITNAVFLAALLGCSPSSREEPRGRQTEERAEAGLEVTEVQLGSKIGDDKKVLDARDKFAPGDTIYATVVTRGSAQSAKLSARWSFENGQVIDESSQTITPRGSAHTEFHVSKPDGWPEGDYRVEILLDGRVVESKDFEVQS